LNAAQVARQPAIGNTRILASANPGEEENWTDQLVPNDVTTPNISGRSITQALDKKNYARTLNK
jgi:hypothetical protein